jgi:hypothetical protein
MSDSFFDFFCGQGTLGVPEALAASDFVEGEHFKYISNILGGGAKVGQIPGQETALRIMTFVLEKCPKVSLVQWRRVNTGPDDRSLSFTAVPQEKITNNAIAALFEELPADPPEDTLESEDIGANIALEQQVTEALAAVGLFDRRVAVIKNGTIVIVWAGDEESAKLAHICLAPVLTEFDESGRAELIPGHGFLVVFLMAQ